MKKLFPIILLLTTFHFLQAQSTVFVPYPEGKTVHYTYDNVGQQWVFQDTLIATYDSLGHNLSQLYLDSMGQYVSQSHTDWSHAPNSTSVTQDWVSGQWVNRQRSTYNFDSHGNKDVYLTEDWRNGAWVVNQYSTHDSSIYDGNGQRLKRYQYTWDTLALAWKPRLTQALWINTYDSMRLSSESIFNYVDTVGLVMTDSIRHFYNISGVQNKIYRFRFDSIDLYGMKPYNIDSLLDNIHYFTDIHGDSASYVHWTKEFATFIAGGGSFANNFDTTWADGGFDDWSISIDYAHSDTLIQHLWYHHIDSLSTVSGTLFRSRFGDDLFVDYHIYSWDGGLPTQVISYSTYTGTTGTDTTYHFKTTFGEYQPFTGIADNPKSLGQAFVYPNPAGDYINISTNEPYNHVVIFDLEGTQVLQATVTESESTLKLSSLKKGVYLLKIYRDNDIVAVRKVMKW